MSDLLFYAISCLILNICKHFLALFKLICNAVFCSSPALRSIISLVQGFCFCDNVFQWCGICITCRFCNILSCCLEFYNVILVSKGMNSKDPVTSSVSSFRKLASSRFCKTKLLQVRARKLLTSKESRNLAITKLRSQQTDSLLLQSTILA